MNFIKFLQKLNDSNGAFWGSAFFTSGAKRLLRLFVLPILILAAISTFTTSAMAAAPSITSNPVNMTILSGQNVTFSVSASDATSYLWQVSTDGGMSFTVISNGSVYSGATAATLNITAATIGMTNYQYRAVVSGSTSPVATSNAATLMVNKATPTINLSTTDYTPVQGTSVTFTAAFSGGASPTGTVEFFDGSNLFGVGAFSGPWVTLTTSALGVGTHVITAVYKGDSNNTATTSPAITVTVLEPVRVTNISLPNPTVGVSYTPVT